jgi:hypothetical protein
MTEGKERGFPQDDARGSLTPTLRIASPGSML